MTVKIVEEELAASPKERRCGTSGRGPAMPAVAALAGVIALAGILFTRDRPIERGEVESVDWTITGSSTYALRHGGSGTHETVSAEHRDVIRSGMDLYGEVYDGYVVVRALDPVNKTTRKYVIPREHLSSIIFVDEK